MRYRFIRFPEGRAKALTLSYDDGCSEDIRFADLLAKYGIKCTFNFNSNAARGEKALPTELVREHILNNGHEIAVHGANHRALGVVRPIEGIRDVLDCRIELENRYGMIIRGMAYPDSGVTRFLNEASYDSVKGYLGELDIAYSRTLGGDNDKFEMPTDWHAWMPTAHHNNPNIFEYIDKFLDIDIDNAKSVSRRPRLFYLWGHSYEFERHNNWDHIEKICERLANKDDIWYATNIELYDYVTAYHSLVYSADGMLVYNPTLIRVWFNVDGKLYEIGSGETIRIEK